MADHIQETCKLTNTCQGEKQRQSNGMLNIHRKISSSEHNFRVLVDRQRMDSNARSRHSRQFPARDDLEANCTCVPSLPLPAFYRLSRTRGANYRVCNRLHVLLYASSLTTSSVSSGPEPFWLVMMVWSKAVASHCSRVSVTEMKNTKLNKKNVFSPRRFSLSHKALYI